MIQLIDIRHDKIKVNFDKSCEDNFVLTFRDADYNDISITMNEETAKALHNVTRKLYPHYSVEPKNSKVCIVLDSEVTPTREMQLFLKGLKLNEVIA